VPIPRVSEPVWRPAFTNGGSRVLERVVDIEERLSRLERPAPAAPGRAIANPAPLGLFAFGLTTLMLNLVNAGAVERDTTALVLAYGIFFGGLCQLAAGMWEFAKGNTFGATAFSAYGAFWMGLALWHVLADNGAMSPASSFRDGFAAILCAWGLFTALMFVGTLKLNRALQAVFLTLTVLFFLLAAGQYSSTVHRVAGWEGIVCAAAAVYTAWALLVDELWEREVLPLGPAR
jgi:succinate-acetate transporter protein